VKNTSEIACPVCYNNRNGVNTNIQNESFKIINNTPKTGIILEFSG
jgi:hypothetical protein